MNSSKIFFLLILSVILFVNCKAACQTICAPTDKSKCGKCSSEPPYLKQCGNCCRSCTPEKKCWTPRECKTVPCRPIQCIPGYIPKVVKCECCPTSCIKKT